MGADDLCTAGPSSAMTIAGGTYLRSNKVYVQGACTGGGSYTLAPHTFDEQAAYVGDPLALVRPPFHRSHQSPMPDRSPELTDQPQQMQPTSEAT